MFAKKATDSVVGSFDVESISPDIICTIPGMWSERAIRPFMESMDRIGVILPQAVFFPAFSMLITIMSARVMSKLFMNDFVGGG
ncbi:MAG: hypothetical protein QW112_02270 [Candidatus Micrarchaeia archaeon]